MCVFFLFVSFFCISALAIRNKCSNARTKTNKVEKGIWELKEVQKTKFQKKCRRSGKTTVERSATCASACIYCWLVHWMLWLSSYVIFHGIFFPACGSNDFLFILCFFFFPCWLCALWPFSFFSACPFCVRFSLCTGSLGKYNYFLLDFAFAYGNLYALYSIRMSFSIFQLLLRSGGDHIAVCDRHRHRYCNHCTECLLFSPLGVCVLKWTMVCSAHAFVKYACN